jgi:hypothetical protein
MVPLVSEEGQGLLTGDSADLDPLQENWVAQLRSHCGAASAVIVQNSLQDDEHHTQDGMFTPETAHIITQDVVYEIGFTLEELNEMIHVRSGLKTEWFRAGPEEGHHGHADFVEALRESQTNPDTRIICNFSVESTRGDGMRAGHFSPIADYNEEEDMALILEVSASREKIWISSEDLWHAMVATDPVCGLNRGWIVVSR